ncbi:RhuM family protein [Alcanivoracaceae bacterium MT1]
MEKQIEGKRRVKRQWKHYSVDASISVGYRVNYHRATQFRLIMNMLSQG